MAVEFWTMGRGTSGAGNPKFLDSASQAARAEEMGYDGIVYVDSQNLAGDCYVASMTEWAADPSLSMQTGPMQVESWSGDLQP